MQNNPSSSKQCFKKDFSSPFERGLFSSMWARILELLFQNNLAEIALQALEMKDGLFEDGFNRPHNAGRRVPLEMMEWDDEECLFQCLPNKMLTLITLIYDCGPSAFLTDPIPHLSRSISRWKQKLFGLRFCNSEGKRKTAVSIIQMLSVVLIHYPFPSREFISLTPLSPPLPSPHLTSPHLELCPLIWFFELGEKLMHRCLESRVVQKTHALRNKLELTRGSVISWEQPSQCLADNK